MNIEQTVVEKLRTLPPEKQQEVLDFVEFLESQAIKGELSSQEEEPPVSALALAQKWDVWKENQRISLVTKNI